MNIPDGLVLSHQPVKIDPRSTFELPVVVQARLAPMNKIHVGCFSGVYGGKIGHCSIGRYCSIAPDVDIASDQHPTDWLSSSMVQYVDDIHGWGSWLRRNGADYNPPAKTFNSNSPVYIGNDVWVGQGVFIKSGVKVGDGAVIASHSVVISDVPAFAIVAGVPAKIKKMRFSDLQIDRLNRLQWWKYNVMSLKGVDFSMMDLALDKIEASIDLGEIEEYLPRVVKFEEIIA